MGGRHSTVESLLDFEPILREKMLGYQETKYAFNRNDWMQYPGTNRRGQICCVRESDQMGFFSNKFWEQISSGSDVLAAARSAYSEVLNYYVIGLKIHNDDMLSIDAFVKTLLHDELSDESIDELEERSA
jgi:hypothetical protein